MNKKKKKTSDFISSLNEQDKERFDKFLKDWNLHLCLNKKDRKKMQKDVMEVSVILHERGKSPDEILKLVDSSNLGGFYAHEAQLWYPLDDAAKIYPISMKYGKMPVFRLSCTLKEEVIPQVLQLALDFTIKRFPSFATMVRKGFFWHYLDSVKKRFVVEKEKGAPCQPLNISYSGAQAFKVMYFGKRIAVEFFHSLTDGTGGMIFLKTLVGEYFRILGVEFEYTNSVLNPNTVPTAAETENEFKRLCPKTKKDGGFMGKAALQMSGRISKSRIARVIQFEMETEKLKEIAHRYEATLTALVLAVMFKAQKYATEALNGTIQIQVPVNMRKFYESKTLRNFAMYCSIDIPVNEITDIESLITEIKKQIEKKSTIEEMSVMMTTAHKLVTSLALIPLAVKVPVAKAIYGYLGDSRFSNTLSNLGQILMPKGLEKRIDSFDFILGTCNISRASCTLCSYENKTVFSVTKITTDPSFEEAILNILFELGLKAEVKGSPVYD